MKGDREYVRAHGTWDPGLDAYVTATDGKTRFFVLRRPWAELRTAAVALMILFGVGVVVATFSVFFRYPDGVAGDHRDQLAEVLRHRYRVSADYLPERWTDTQVFSVGVEQGWDEPDYNQPERTFADCRLQPGGSSDDLSLQCRSSPDGPYEDLPEGGQPAWHDRDVRRMREDPASAYDYSYQWDTDDEGAYLLDEYEQEYP